MFSDTMSSFFLFLGNSVICSSTFSCSAQEPGAAIAFSYIESSICLIASAKHAGRSIDEGIELQQLI